MNQGWLGLQASHVHSIATSGDINDAVEAVAYDADKQETEGLRFHPGDDSLF